jgi:hypothetical protein
MNKLKNAFKKLPALWQKIPHTTQMTVISTIVCTLLTASGASQDACQIARQLLTNSPEPVQTMASD